MYCQNLHQENSIDLVMRSGLVLKCVKVINVFDMMMENIEF